MKIFNVPNFYKSEILTNLKNNRKKLDPLKKDFSPYILQFDGLEIIIARHFGFCYGVENAIEIAFSAIENEKGKRIFLLSEMIHNPNVNADLIKAGIQFLQDTKGNQLIPFEILNSNDIVLIPAFGTTIEIEEKLQKQGVQFKKYNTTCPFVEKVWNRSEQIARNGFTLIIHGKPTHEETRATFSHINRHTNTIIVNDITEARLLGDLILTNKNIVEIEKKFKNRVSENFDFIEDLMKIGVVNQTTQLSTETLFISNYFKEIMIKKYGELEIKNHFADTKDTLCYATNDNQNAVKELVKIPADLAMVIGGANSSNTSHLVEICEEKLPTYFVDSSKKIIDFNNILNINWKTKEVEHKNKFLPNKKNIKILLTSGASCPDAIVEEVIEKIKLIYHSNFNHIGG